MSFAKRLSFVRKPVVILLVVLALLLVTGSIVLGAEEIKVSHSVTIDRPVEEVFAFTSNPENFALYTTGVNEMRMASMSSEASMGVGAVLVQEREILGVMSTSQIKVTEYVPNKRISYVVTSGFGEGIMSEEEVQEASGGDATILTFTARGPLKGFSRLSAPFVNQLYQRQLEIDLNTLKALLES